MNIVKQRARIGPIALDGLDRLCIRERAASTDQFRRANVLVALEVCPVTGRAGLGIDLPTLSVSALSGRQSTPVRHRVYVDAGNLLLRGGLSDPEFKIVRVDVPNALGAGGGWRHRRAFLVFADPFRKFGDRARRLAPARAF